MNDITWAPIIPLIGGFPIGAELATGVPPKFIASYNGFLGNDKHYINYQQNTKGRDVSYRILDDEKELFDSIADIIVATPPCAALSSLNCNVKNPAVAGATAESTKWMDYSLRDAIERCQAKVYICENAPGLYTNKGVDMAKRLVDTAAKYGYSSTLYKTTTSLHGIPQNRDRTFFIAWNSKFAPVMPWFNRQRKTLAEYLDEVPHDAIQHDIIINEKLTDEPYYVYIKEKIDPDVRTVLKEQGIITTFKWVDKNGKLEDALEFFKKIGHEKGIKYASHSLKKHSQGLGVWDGSVHSFEDAFNAFIGRNANDSIHPTQDRSLTIREGAHLMGLPMDFELIGGLKNMNHLCQNVPTCTGRDMVLTAMDFINGKLECSGVPVMRQNNHNQRFDVKPVSKSLDSFF